MNPEAAAAADRLAAIRPHAAIVRAPGRVNLIGGQVDYHEGPVVAMAIDREVAVGATPRTDGLVVVRSLDLDGVVEIAADGSAPAALVEPRWGRLVGGVVNELTARGRPAVGMDALVASTLPIGSGLSSSAAFEVAIALALQRVAAWHIDVVDLVDALLAAELAATGVPCGIQDQTVSLSGAAGHVIALDCRTRVATTIALPAAARVVVIDSGVPRTLEGSPWTARRRESFAVAERLGLRVLRDASLEQVADDPRGRHVVSEIARVRDFEAALRRDDLETAGALMVASHASSRDDMEVSIPELDTLVECLLEAGSYGARLTGGGFGGCCVALAPAEHAARIAAEAAASYQRRTTREPRSFIVDPSPGAGTVVSTRPNL